MNREMMAEAGLQLMRYGYHVMPGVEGKKHPLFHGWSERGPYTRFEWLSHARRKMVNVILDLRDHGDGGLLCADCDSPEVRGWVEEQFGKSPLVIVTSRGFNLLYRRLFAMQKKQ